MASHTQTFRNRFNVLARFDEADEIASFLRKKRVKGTILDGDFCPIANYLRVCGDHSLDVTVHPTTAYLYPDQPTDKVYQVPMTQAMHEFVDLFDKRQYPDLIEPRYSEGQ